MDRTFGAMYGPVLTARLQDAVTSQTNTNPTLNGQPFSALFDDKATARLHGALVAQGVKLEAPRDPTLSGQPFNTVYGDKEQARLASAVAAMQPVHAPQEDAAVEPVTITEDLQRDYADILLGDASAKLKQALADLRQAVADAQQASKVIPPELQIAVAQLMGHENAQGLEVAISATGEVSVSPVFPVHLDTDGLLAAMVAVCGGQANKVILTEDITARWLADSPDADADAETRTYRALRKMGTGRKALVRMCGGGRWIVTQRGLNHAGAGPANAATIEWLEDRWPEVWDRCNRALPKYLSRSADMGLLQTHLQQFALTLLRRDSIGKRRDKGKKDPSLAQVQGWALNSAITDIRSWGRDAATRATRGALTERGFTQRDEQVFDAEIPFRDSFLSAPDNTVIRTEEGADVYYGGDMRQDAETQEFLNNAMGIIEAAISKHMANPDRYNQVAHLLVDGYRIKDIAEVQGVSAARVTAMRKTIMSRIKKAGALDQLGLKLPTPT